MLLGRRHETEAHSGLNRDSDNRVQIPRTMMAAVAYATEFGVAKRQSKRNGNPPSNETRRRTQKERAASKTMIPKKIRKGIDFLAAVASTKPKYGGLRITNKEPFVEFREGQNHELFSKRVLQMIEHYTDIKIGVTKEQKPSTGAKDRSIGTKSSLGSKRTDDLLRDTIGEEEHPRYKGGSYDEQYKDAEQKRLRLFFLCELAFNEAKFITKGVTKNMINGRDITGVMNDLVEAAEIVDFNNLNNGLGYDSMTKREQDLYCAISLMATKAGLWTQKMYGSQEQKLTKQHALFSKLTKLGFDSQFDMSTQNSQKESASGMWTERGFTNILKRLQTTKYEHTEQIIRNLEAETAETVSPVIGSTSTSPGTTTGKGSNTKGSNNPKPKTVNTHKATLDAHGEKMTSASKERGVDSAKTHGERTTIAGYEENAQQTEIHNKRKQTNISHASTGVTNPVAAQKENIKKKTHSVQDGGADTNSEGLDTQDKTSSKTHGKEKETMSLQEQSYDDQDDESHDTVNIALVGVEDATKTVLTDQGIIENGWYYELPENKKASDVEDNTSLLIVRLHAKKEKDIKNAIQSYVHWQNEKGKRSAIFVDRGSDSVWKAIEGTFNELRDKSYRLFYATIRSGSGDGNVNLYWFSDAHDGVTSASEYITNDRIKWEEHQYVGDYEGTYGDDGDYGGTDEHAALTSASRVKHGKSDTKEKERKDEAKKDGNNKLNDHDDDSDLHRVVTEEETGPKKELVAEEEGPINTSDPIKIAIQKVVKDGTNASSYERTSDLTANIKDGTRLIFVVLPQANKGAVAHKEKKTEKQKDSGGIRGIEAYLDKFLNWQGEQDDRLAVFVAGNDDPDPSAFIEHAQKKDSSVFVHTEENVNMKMYCIVKGEEIKHDYVSSDAQWNKVSVSDESDEQSVESRYHTKGADVLVVGTDDANQTARSLFCTDAVYKVKAQQERGVMYGNRVVVIVGCTSDKEASISNEVEAVLVVCSNPDQWKKELDCLKKLCKANKENKTKYVFWIGRPDNKRVLLLAKKGPDYEFKNEAGGLGLSCTKWGLVSEISLIDASKTTTNLVLLDESRDAPKEEYKYEVHIPPPSDEVMRIRRSGIQCAVDYITATKSNAECAMAGLRSAVMTDIQRLVYLTLDHEAPVRIFAIAAGSGKTRCMGLALYSSIVQHGNGEPVCMIMKQGTARSQLVNEIMTGMYVNDSTNGSKKQSYIAKHESTRDQTILSVFGGYVYGYKQYNGGGDNLEEEEGMKNDSFEKVRAELESNRVFIVFLEDLDSGDTKTKGAITSILSTCKVVIADECNGVLPYMSSMTKCESFIGLSATPFDTEEEIKGLMVWSNELKKKRKVAEEGYEEFIKNNVVYVSEDDVRSILPYAERQFDILYANLKSDATKDVYYDMTIDIEKETQETTEGRTSVKKTIDSFPCKDRKAQFAEDEYEAAMGKVLETLLKNRREGVFRSLVIIPSSTYATKFMEKVAASEDLVAIKATEDDWEVKYLKAVGEQAENTLVLADFQKSKTNKSTKSAQRGFPAKVRDDTFNALNGIDENNPGKHKSFLAMVTDELDAVEYHGVSNTYIINTPLDKNKCEQARNRAFRMCSHNRETEKNVPKEKGQKEKDSKEKGQKPKTHKIWYVVVERPLSDGTKATRGAYAIANAHPALEGKNNRITTLLSGAVRFQYDKKNTTKVFGKIERSSWFHDQSEDVQKLCNAGRAAAYTNSLKGDFSKLQDGAVTVLDLAAHLDSTALRIQTHDVRIETMIKVISAGKISTGTAVKFDNGEYPVPFHHTLRGICFDRLDNEPGTYGKGDLVLQYTTKHGPIDQNVSVVTNISELNASHVIEDAQASYQVCAGVQRAFYVGAHRVQCTGHARFECFRVFGPTGLTVTRSFVGTEDQFNAFIETLASGDNHRGICRHEEKSNTRVTPMMIAAWIRRSLFRRRRVTVGYNSGNKKHADLVEYLQRELLIGEWNQSLVTFNDINTLQTQIEITVDGAAAATRVVYDPKTSFTKSKKSAQKQKGALYIFDKDEDFKKAKSLWVLPPADKFPTVNIRGMNPFKTMIGDKHCVRCDTATYVSNKELHDLNDPQSQLAIERVVTNDGTIDVTSKYEEPTGASSSKASAV